MQHNFLGTAKFEVIKDEKEDKKILNYIMDAFLSNKSSFHFLVLYTLKHNQLCNGIGQNAICNNTQFFPLRISFDQTSFYLLWICIKSFDNLVLFVYEAMLIVN